MYRFDQVYISFAERSKDIPSVIDHQCKDYAAHIREEDAPLLAGAWGGYKVPFVFAANGRPYLEQLETMSGVWFLDLRRPDNTPRVLRGWPGPAGLLDMLASSILFGRTSGRILDARSPALFADCGRDTLYPAGPGRAVLVTGALPLARRWWASCLPSIC